ncbi:DUF4352 domain-containing protein [Actinoplanes missouriensis]|uniref:DUF4352 domain-containing protein n=1 Tax=Actinoplanes missouriensis TaxID=1866 RepID=UPI00340645F2
MTQQPPFDPNQPGAQVPPPPYPGAAPGQPPYPGAVPGQPPYPGAAPGQPYPGAAPGQPYPGAAPGQPYPGQPPYPGAVPGQPYPPQPPAKKSKKKLIIGGIAGVILLACLGTAITGGGDDTAAPEKTTAAADAGKGDAPAADEVKAEETKAEETKKAEEPAKDETPGLKDAARDGKFEFKVTSVKCGVKQIGSDFLNQKAQGQYCLINVSVKNIGKEAQDFADSVQKAFDADKVEYAVDSGAAIYLEDNKVLFTKINPGNTVKGTLVFDVPKGTKLTSVELHDSMFSGGVTVNLK